MKYCPRCGSRVDEEDRFCNKCGADLGAFAPIEPEPEPIVQPMPEKKSVSVRWFPVIVVTLILLGASIGGIFLLTDNLNPSDKNTQVTYSWKMDDHSYSITITVSSEQLQPMKKSIIDKTGTVSSDYYKRTNNQTAVYGVKDYIVVDDSITKVKDDLKQYYNAISGEKPSFVQFLACFVQDAIDYETDNNDSGEYWKYPLETLMDGKGDCEDTAILLAALLIADGYDAGIYLLPGHAMSAIKADQVTVDPQYAENEHFGYYPIETAVYAHTQDRYDVGEVAEMFVYAYFHLYTGHSTAYA